MDVTAYTSDHRVQAAEIAEALEGGEYFVTSVKVYRRETGDLQDEWAR
jgi:hypothetical protein